MRLGFRLFFAAVFASGACADKFEGDPAVGGDGGTSSLSDARAPDGGPSTADGSVGPDSGDNRDQVYVPLTFNLGRPGVMVSFAGGPPVNALLDTGTTGIWVLPDAIAVGAAVLGDGGSLAITYGDELTATGRTADVDVALGGSHVVTTVAVANSITCLRDGGNCDSSSFFGAYRAVIGVGLRTAETKLPNLLRLLTVRGRWMLSFDPIGAPTGTLVLDPPTLAQRFVEKVSLAGDGVGGWDDTQVPFCIYEFCQHGLLDSGNARAVLVTKSTADRTALHVGPSAPYLTAGTYPFTVNTSSAFSLDVSASPRGGMDLFLLSSTAGFNDLGVVPLRYVDAYYDAASGQIGVAVHQPLPPH